MKINAISQDFPFKSLYSNRSPNVPKEEKPFIKVFSEIRNGYSNENPDFFRIDSMKENNNSYKNPFLGEVIQEDRNSFYKNMNKTRDQIVNLIDKLKTKKEYSQNTNYLKCVTSSFDLDIINKRNQINIDKDKKKSSEDRLSSYLTLDRNSDGDLYKRTIKKLAQEYSPKNHYLVKKSLELERNNSIINTLENPNIPLKLEIDPRKSSYLKNLNDFNIRESYQNNDDKYIYFDKKEKTDFNCVSDSERKINPDKLTCNKWGSFYENYFLLNNKDKAFAIKGGLFSEFSDKNKDYIEMKKLVNGSKIKNSEKNNSQQSSPKTERKNSLKKNKKENGSPLLNKAREIIEDRNLFKLKNYLVKSGAIKNK